MTRSRLTHGALDRLWAVTTRAVLPGLESRSTAPRLQSLSQWEEDEGGGPQRQPRPQRGPPRRRGLRAVRWGSHLPEHHEPTRRLYLSTFRVAPRLTDSVRTPALSG